MAVSAAVVPAAGLGTRLLPLTRAVPKELLPLGRKPVLQCVVEELQDSGIDKIALVTSEDKLSLHRHFAPTDALQRELSQSGKAALVESLRYLHPRTRLLYVDQPQQLGLGHAVLCAEQSIGRQPFVIALGDAMIGLTDHASLCRRMINIFEQNQADAVIAFQTVPLEHVSRYGIAEPSASVAGDETFFVLKDLVEKPAIDQAPSRYAIAARYICSDSVFTLLRQTEPDAGGEIQLTDALRQLIRNGGKVLGVPVNDGERRFDVGNFESYFTAFIENALADPEHGAKLRVQLARLLDQTKQSH